MRTACEALAEMIDCRVCRQARTSATLRYPTIVLCVTDIIEHASVVEVCKMEQPPRTLTC